MRVVGICGRDAKSGLAFVDRVVAMNQSAFGTNVDLAAVVGTLVAAAM